MKVVAFPLFCFAAARLSWAQAPVGVTPVWELEKQLAALVQQTRRLTPVIDEVKPKSWPADAPAAYAQQQAEAKAQVEYLARSAAALAREPEKMTLALDAFLRLETLEGMLDSLSEGVRRYQNPALGDLMQGMISENSVHRGRLRNYLVELVSTKQDELRVANDEAQNCRTGALRPPPRPVAPRAAKPVVEKKP